MAVCPSISLKKIFLFDFMTAPRKYSSVSLSCLDEDSLRHILKYRNENNVACVSKTFLKEMQARIRASIKIQRACAGVLELNALYAHSKFLSEEALSYPKQDPDTRGGILDVEDVYWSVRNFWEEKWCSDISGYDLALMVGTVMINLWEGRPPFYLHESCHPHYGLAPVTYGYPASSDLASLFQTDFKQNVSHKIHTCTKGDLYWHDLPCRHCWGIVFMGYDGDTGTCCYV